MELLDKSRYYIRIKSFRELQEAQRNTICKRIIYEVKNVIYIWNRQEKKWVENIYVVDGSHKDFDYKTSGFEAYCKFCKYVGMEELEKMKLVYNDINIFDSTEQMHYANIEQSHIKIYKPIYVYDCNSSFTYGALQLPEQFNKLKEYLLYLYEQKKKAKTKLDRSKFKNLQNYLIGYFARVKGLITVRSDIIKYSNQNIVNKMREIHQAGGTVYISNTDSIITDEIGNTVMQKYKGDDVGQFKLEAVSDKLFYKSSNCYQVGNKIKYSGIEYFANKHTDFFKDLFAEQYGSLIKDYDYDLEESEEDLINICSIDKDKIIVVIKNGIGETIQKIIYKIKE